MDKLGLNRKGHLVFSLGLVIFAIYFLSHYIKINYTFILFHSLFFFLGVSFPDLVEFPTDPWHRGMLHKGFLLALIPLAVLVFYYLWSITPKVNFIGIQFNYCSIAISFLGGWLSHLWGDALTSKLR